MELVKCKQCGGQNRADIARCPTCNLGVFKVQLWWIPMAAICGFLLFAFMRTENPLDRQEAQDRTTIDSCRMQADNADAPQDRAVDCEKLIAQFMEKYGVHPY